MTTMRVQAAKSKAAELEHASLLQINDNLNLLLAQKTKQFEDLTVAFNNQQAFVKQSQYAEEMLQRKNEKLLYMLELALVSAAGR